MKLYHVTTRNDYEKLMAELESKGLKWPSGCGLQEFDGFERCEENTVIKVENSHVTVLSLSTYKSDFSEFELIECATEKKVNDSIVMEIIKNLVNSTQSNDFNELQEAKRKLDGLLEKK